MGKISIPGSYLDVWYDITGEMGTILKSGSAYTYQFFVVFNGNRYTSPVKTFSTLGREPLPETPEDPKEDVCDHVYSDWKTTKKATVFAAEQQKRECSLCKDTDTRTIGTKLTPTIYLNVTNIILKTQQSTSEVNVSGLAEGDYIIFWSTSDDEIATVDNSGKITAMNKEGSAVITVTLASGKTAQIGVRVQNTKVQTTKISGLKKTLSLKVRKRITLKPVISPSTSTQKVTYKSSNKKILTVSSSGKVTAKKKGKATITVRSGNKSFKIKVIVR